MVSVDAPRFELDEANTEAQREFISALHVRAESAGWFAHGWEDDERVTITIDISDNAPEHNVVLRMLRVDFDGVRLLMGPDETSQLATDPDPRRNGVTELVGPSSNELASVAADWLECEMRRPVERLEWDQQGFTHRRWRYADTKERLVWSDSANKKRADLGPPHRVVNVR